MLDSLYYNFFLDDTFTLKLLWYIESCRKYINKSIKETQKLKTIFNLVISTE